MSAFSNAREIEPHPIWTGVTSRPVHGEQMTLSLIELEPDANVPEHHHENEQIGILIQGSLSFTIGDETAEVVPGGTWCILANVPHTVTAGPDGAVLAEVFSPPRHDWHAIEKHAPGPGRWP